MRVWMLALACLFGCQKAKEPFDPEPAADLDVADYEATSDHLLDFVYGGFGLVSLTPDGAPAHQGEALIWGGTSLWSLSCGDGKGISSALRAMILANAGALVRVDPIGEYGDGRQVTLDGALGAMLGIARRVRDCDEAALWREPIFRMVKFQAEHNNRLHPDVEAKMSLEFAFIRDAIAHQVGLRDEPDAARRRDLEKTIGGWPAAVQLAHATGQNSDACFRVNLALTAVLSLETLGYKISDGGRDQFCANTVGMDIPTVDHWCGRKPIDNYLSSYRVDEYEYRHQRCGSPWESADGKGNASNRLDRLVALVFKHGWAALQR